MMKKQIVQSHIVACILGMCTFSHAQESKRFINEIQGSVNHGIPVLSTHKAFFGAGLGVSHVFRDDRVLGARIGLDADFFHYWAPDQSEPGLERRTNQHFYLSNLSIPLAIRLNFGQKTRFFFELGGRLGVIVHQNYRAMVYPSVSKVEPFSIGEQVNQNRYMNGAFVGLNTGLGVRFPVSEQLELLIKPDVGASIYYREFLHMYGRLCIGIHLK